MPRMPRIPQSDGVGRGSSDNQVLQAPAACQYRRCVGYCLLTLAALAALVVATGMSAPILSALHAATGPNAGGMCVYGSLVSSFADFVNPCAPTTAPLMMPPTSLGNRTASAALHHTSCRSSQQPTPAVLVNRWSTRQHSRATYRATAAACRGDGGGHRLGVCSLRHVTCQ